MLHYKLNHLQDKQFSGVTSVSPKSKVEAFMLWLLEMATVCLGNDIAEVSQILIKQLSDAAILAGGS